MLSHHHVHPYLVQDVAFFFSLAPGFLLLALSLVRSGPPGL